jgi:endonuclease/exonuclease/phosphatase family metal-dependent hydrolase
MALTTPSRRDVIVGTGAALGTVGSGDLLGELAETTSLGTDDDPDDSTDVMTACSFNVRYDSSEDAYPWGTRLPRVAETIDQLDPDLLGVQEAQPNQFADLEETITDYEWYGVGREGGDDSEAVPIAWPTDRFEVEETGVFWLSPTPDVPSIGWDAENPRVSTWASLRDRETGTDLWFCNTHFSHVDPTARRHSAEIIRRHAQRRAEEGRSVVVTGDLNSVPTAPPYHVLTGQTGAGESPLVDGRREAGTTAVYGPWGTFHGFTDELEDRIDYVFTPDDAEVRQYRTLGIREGAYRSDHLPVVARFAP